MAIFQTCRNWHQDCDQRPHCDHGGRGNIPVRSFSSKPVFWKELFLQSREQQKKQVRKVKYDTVYSASWVWGCYGLRVLICSMHGAWGFGPKEQQSFGWSSDSAGPNFLHPAADSAPLLLQFPFKGRKVCCYCVEFTLKVLFMYFLLESGKIEHKIPVLSWFGKLVAFSIGLRHLWAMGAIILQDLAWVDSWSPLSSQPWTETE